MQLNLYKLFKKRIVKLLMLLALPDMTERDMIRSAVLSVFLLPVGYIGYICFYALLDYIAN